MRGGAMLGRELSQARHSCTITQNLSNRCTQMASRSPAGQSVVIVHATQVVFIDGTAYSPAQSRTCNLVESKMYSAINARVGDIVGYLLKRGVLQDDVGHRRIRQRDRVSSFAVHTSQNFGSSTTSAAVVGGIARETWRSDKGDEAGIRIGFRVAICVASMDCCFRSPKIVVVLIEERSNQAVTDSHVD